MILDIHDILNVVCIYYGLPKEKLLSVSRRNEIVLPRQVFYHFSRKYTALSLENIGELRKDLYGFKEHDHATILHADNKIKGFLDVDNVFISQYMELETSIIDTYYNNQFTKIIPLKVDLLEICKRNSQSLKNYIAA